MDVVVPPAEPPAGEGEGGAPAPAKEPGTGGEPHGNAAAPPEGEDADGTGDGQGEPAADQGGGGEEEEGDGDGTEDEHGSATGANPLLGADVAEEPKDWSADPESVEDLKKQVETEPDRRLLSVYGDTVHRNDGRHLRGGVDAATNERHIQWFDRVVAHNHPLWRPPKNAVGKEFINILSGLWEGVIQRRWNAEFPMIFCACILRVEPGTVATRKIKQRIKQRLDLWKEGRQEALVSQIETAAWRSAGRGRRRKDEESEARSFNSKVLSGKLRAAVRNLTAREGGGVRAASETCTKTGDNIVDVLRAKHPDLRVPDVGSPDCLAFEEYARVPTPVPIIADETGAEAAATKWEVRPALTAWMQPMPRSTSSRTRACRPTFAR